MTLEIFFDYACPFCKVGHEYLDEILPAFPQLELSWRPCEANPRPARFGPHSDLLARGMYIARELGADLQEIHRRFYDAALTNRLDIEDPEVVAKLVEDLVDVAAFRDALGAGAYETELAANNRATWEEHCFDAVPSLALDGKTLPSVPMVGLTEAAIRKFLEEAHISL